MRPTRPISERLSGDRFNNNDNREVSMRSMNRYGVRAVGVVAASLAAVLAGCGGGGGPEPVNLDPTALCNSVGAQPKVANGASCVSFKSTPVVFLLIVRAGGVQVACSGTRISPTHVLCVD
eukprot:Opistho-1_new@87093